MEGACVTWGGHGGKLWSPAASCRSWEQWRRARQEETPLALEWFASVALGFTQPMCGSRDHRGWPSGRPRAPISSLTCRSSRPAVIRVLMDSSVGTL